MLNRTCEVCYKQQATHKCLHCETLYCGKACFDTDEQENQHALVCAKRRFFKMKNSKVKIAYKYISKEFGTLGSVAADVSAIFRYHAAAVTEHFLGESFLTATQIADDSILFSQTYASLFDASDEEMRRNETQPDIAIQFKKSTQRDRLERIKEYFTVELSALERIAYDGVSDETNQQQNLDALLNVIYFMALTDSNAIKDVEKRRLYKSIVAESLYEPWKRYWTHLVQMAVSYRSTKRAKSKDFDGSYKHAIEALMEAQTTGVIIKTLLRGPKADVTALNDKQYADLKRDYTPILNIN